MVRFGFIFGNEKNPNGPHTIFTSSDHANGRNVPLRKNISRATRVGQAQATVANSKEKFSAQNFHSASTDAHIDYSVTLPVGANENLAGTLHLNALFDQNLFA
jgi:hypothetical protein